MTFGTTPSEKARVLIAEDQPMNQMIVKSLLQKFKIGFVEIANNGAVVLKRYGETSWDVILMDCHMPEKDGYAATEEIRALESNAGKHTPIVAMTGDTADEDREKCLRCGMDDYISKPVKVDELKKILEQWISFQTP